MAQQQEAAARPKIGDVRGWRLRLRLIEPDDAAYVHALRIDPRYNTHLSQVSGGAEDQRAWIEAYKAREAEGREFYFVIERLDGVRCGLVRLYDITADGFTWGSWILDGNKPPKAALESALLSFDVGFETLGGETAHIDVRQGNAQAIAFYRRFGMTEVGVDEQNLYFDYTRGQHRRNRERYIEILEADTRRAS